MKTKALVPVEQALVPFYAWLILAVRLPDGRIAASLRSLCDLLNLSRWGRYNAFNEMRCWPGNSCKS